MLTKLTSILYSVNFDRTINKIIYEKTNTDTEKPCGSLVEKCFIPGNSFMVAI